MGDPEHVANEEVVGDYLISSTWAGRSISVAAGS